MSKYFLGEHVSLCAIDDAVILLDVRRDRYLQIRGELGATVQRLAGSGPAGIALPNEMAARLIAMGVASQRQSGCPPHPRPVPATSDSFAVHHITSRGGWLRTMTCLTYLIVGRLAAKLLPFRLLVRWLEHEGRRPGMQRPSAIGPTLAAFAVAQRLVPWQPLCLPDATALSLLLWRRGWAARMIIGVKQAPFEAHSWVQLGGTVLNDSFDRVRCFTPIRQI